MELKELLRWEANNFLKSITYYLILFAVVFILCAISACSGDSSVNPVNPPSAQDSVVLLNSPADDTVLTISDSLTVILKWNLNSFADAYHCQWATDSLFSFQTDLFSDSNSVSQTFNTPSGVTVIYWHVRIFRPNSPYAPWSETRKFSVQ